MPTGPKGEKRPADVIGNAVKVMRTATGEESGDRADLIRRKPLDGDLRPDCERDRCTYGRSSVARSGVRQNAAQLLCSSDYLAHS